MTANTPPPDSPGALERLKALVRQHRVCWEVWPEQLAVKDRGPLQVGFDLVLNGAHAHDKDRPSPGCEKCKLIFERLREVAEWIVPKVERPSRYNIQIFDHAVHYAPERCNRPDVSLTIKILHRSQIGAQHRQWK